MKVSSGLKSFVLAASILAAATAGVRATTLTYFGEITGSPYDFSLGEIGKTWELSAVLPDPLVDYSPTPEQGYHLYLPLSVTVTIGGVDRAAGLSLAWQVQAGYNYYGYSGTAVAAMSWGAGGNGFDGALVRLSSPATVTSTDGLLLPGVPIAQFENREFSFRSSDGANFYWVEGNVTGYTTTNDVPLPDSAATALLLGLGLAVLPLLRRRGAPDLVRG